MRDDGDSTTDRNAAQKPMTRVANQHLTATTVPASTSRAPRSPGPAMSFIPDPPRPVRPGVSPTPNDVRGPYPMACARLARSGAPVVIPTPQTRPAVRAPTVSLSPARSASGPAPLRLGFFRIPRYGRQVRAHERA